MSLVQAVKADEPDEEEALVESIVSMIASLPEGNVTEQVDSDQEAVSYTHLRAHET